jgi:hypothetical protein
MTDKQLAIMLADYKMQIAQICHSLDDEDYTTAKAMAHCLDARLRAVLKSLDVEVFISPLG